MGEVYLAEDTKLRRRVALKILPVAIGSHKDRMRRFMQEAQAAAALNHPNIAHVYKVNEVEGQHFIAMEFIDGTTLREDPSRTALRKADQEQERINRPRPHSIHSIPGECVSFRSECEWERANCAFFTEVDANAYN